MLEVCSIIAIVIACSIVIVFFVKWCHVLYDNHGADAKAMRDLEDHMRYNHVASVRALIEVRGHLLPKAIRDNAKVWLAEH